MTILSGVLIVVFSVLVFISTKFPKIGLVVFILASFLQEYIVNPIVSPLKNVAGENATFFNVGFVYSLVQFTIFLGVFLCLVKVFKEYVFGLKAAG